jgi:hypothetical protein
MVVKSGAIGGCWSGAKFAREGTRRALEPARGHRRSRAHPDVWECGEPETNAQTATPVAEVSPTIAPISPPQPCVFIASAVEGLPIGEAIALDLQFVADVTICEQDVFPSRK